AAVRMAVIAALLLKRAMGKSQRSRRADPQKQVRAQMQAAETSVGGIVRNMEVELHNYQREVEGRIETKLAVLAELMDVADQEIDHLSHLLEDMRPHITRATIVSEAESPAETGSRRFDLQQRQMIRSLLGAGFDLAEVARMLGCTSNEIERDLDDDELRRAG
ncbi:MAG: hypothetical protein ABGZ17_31165, partial [Planctomycetaceae bacterium]